MAKTLTGVVVSDKGDKTIVIRIQISKTHPIYSKQYYVSNKVMAHDEANKARPGDTVVIEETRPISARKRFMLKKITKTAAIEHIDIAPELPAKEKPADAKKAVVKKETK